MNIIAKTMTQRRKELGMTQREMAEKLHVSDKTISRWETGKQVPDALMIPEIAAVLGLRIEEVYGSGVNLEKDIPPQRQKQIPWFWLVLFTIDVFVSVCVPMIRHTILFRHNSVAGITAILISNLIIFVGVLYYKRCWFAISIGLLGIMSYVGYLTYILRPLQAGNQWVFFVQRFGPDCVLAIGTGVIFVCMQAAGYWLQLNEKKWKRIWVALGMVSVVGIALFCYPYTQKSLYNEMAEDVTAVISEVTIGVNPGMDEETYSYFTISEQKHVEELLRMLRKIRVSKGKPSELEEEKTKACRIQLGYKYYSKQDLEYINWDVTLRENGEMWYRGEYYEIENEVDWDALFELAIREYDGENKELYENLINK